MLSRPGLPLGWWPIRSGSWFTWRPAQNSVGSGRSPRSEPRHRRHRGLLRTTTTRSRNAISARTIRVTLKGAINSRVGERGIIPGSVGTDTFIVVGRGNADSYSPILPLVGLDGFPGWRLRPVSGSHAAIASAIGAGEASLICHRYFARLPGSSEVRSATTPAVGRSVERRRRGPTPRRRRRPPRRGSGRRRG